MITTFAMALADVVQRAERLRAEHHRSATTEAVRELVRLRARNAPVCGFSRLVATPAEWKKNIGYDAARLRLGSATHPNDLLLDQVTPDAHVVRALVAYTVFANASGGTVQPAATVATSVAYELFTYIRASLRGAPNVLRLDDGIVENLISTDCEDIGSADVRLPFEALFVEFKASPLKISDSKGALYPVKFMSVAEVFGPSGREWFVSCFGEPVSRVSALMGGPAYCHRLALGERITLSEAEAVGSRPTECLGSVLDWDGYVTAIRRLIVNLMLYVSSPNPDIRLASGAGGTSAWEEAVSADRTSPRAPRRSRSLWDVGATVQRLRVAVMDVLVRGHWRRQVCGPGGQMRRLIWIQPHVRMPTGAPVPGHDYKVAT